MPFQFEWTEIKGCDKTMSTRDAGSEPRNLQLTFRINQLADTRRGSDPLLLRGQIRVSPNVGSSASLHLRQSRSDPSGSESGEAAAAAAGVKQCKL
jgi:hypothetical protein